MKNKFELAATLKALIIDCIETECINDEGELLEAAQQETLQETIMRVAEFAAMHNLSYDDYIAR